MFTFEIIAYPCALTKKGVFHAFNQMPIFQNISGAWFYDFVAYVEDFLLRKLGYVICYS